MADVKSLGPAQCLLLAVSLASDSNIPGLHALVTQRPDVLQLELVLRIVLTYLPESVEPGLLVPLLAQLGSTGDEQKEAGADNQGAVTAASVFPVDVSSVSALSEDDAAARARKIRILKLHDSQQRRQHVQDPLVLFLIHRSHRIDSETGLLQLVPQLVCPFLHRSIYLRQWFVSTVLPLLRLEHEYYPQPEAWTALVEFEALEGLQGVTTLLQTATRQRDGIEGEAEDCVSRDVRCIVGPWVYGGSLRKRRRTASATETRQDEETAEDATEAWQDVFEWIVNTAATDFAMAEAVIARWDGPEDVDLGGYEQQLGTDPDSAAALQYHLRSKYYQAAFAATYASEADTARDLERSRRVLTRIADLCGFERPPPADVQDVVQLLGSSERNTTPLEEIPKSFLQPESLLRPDQPLTIPTPDSFALLQQLVVTASLLTGLGHAVSVCKAAKLRFWSDESEQHRLLHKILDGLGPARLKTEQDCIRLRQTLLWLWSWGVDDGDGDQQQAGYGIFGKLPKAELERALLKLLCSADQCKLAVSIYLPPAALGESDVEAAAVEAVLHHYDAASNGNRTRGGVKRAQDVLAAFRAALPQSTLLRRLAALISATHSLSFYALTLQQGVPLQPVAMRSQPDPVTLLEHVLEQNQRAYTKLDDLVQIGRQLAVALDHDPAFRDPSPKDAAEEAARATAVERHVLGMTIEAALREHDFETAYSYVVNRLPSSSPATSETAEQDDVSWRAAFAAGRHRTSPASSSSSLPSQPHHQSKPSGTSTTTSPTVRRLEQRMELLSTALLLAPPAALPEVLAAWRRCEEELLTVLAAEAAEETAFDDQADAGRVRTVPGGFVGDAAFSVQPQRKELGRGAAEEAPMGLFDVARGAAQAFGRSAAAARLTSSSSPLSHSRQASAASAATATDGRDSIDGGDGTKQRKRDVVASAVTGGLISGMSWVLGAKPVEQ